MNHTRCYTYFKITGVFEPDIISEMLGLVPEKICKIGNERKNGTKYDFAMWNYGYCNKYDITKPISH